MNIDLSAVRDYYFLEKKELGIHRDVNIKNLEREASSSPQRNVVYIYYPVFPCVMLFCVVFYQSHMEEYLRNRYRRKKC